jgi:hypothetical protein
LTLQRNRIGYTRKEEIKRKRKRKRKLSIKEKKKKIMNAMAPKGKWHFFLLTENTVSNITSFLQDR